MRKKELEAEVTRLRRNLAREEHKEIGLMLMGFHNRAITERMWEWDEEAYNAIARLRSWWTGEAEEVRVLKLENEALRKRIPDA